MILTVLAFAAVVLCVLGLSELVFCLRLFLLSPKTKEKSFLTLFLTENDCILQLITAAEKFNWYGNSVFDGIIAVTDALSYERLAMCEQTNRYLSGTAIIFCKQSELINTLDYLKNRNKK